MALDSVAANIVCSGVDLVIFGAFYLDKSAGRKNQSR